MSRVNSLHHIVFNTYQRERTIPLTERRHLYAFLHSIITANHCSTLRIGGTDNHVHLLIDLHPTKALSWLVGELKRSSSVWMKQSGRFLGFHGWAHEYFATSISSSGKESVIRYIMDQVNHHRKISFEEEINEICQQNGFEWKPEYFK